MSAKNIAYSKDIAQRILTIMEIIDLDIAGFAEFFNKSTSHIYGILNGTRPLSETFAVEIGKKLNFEGNKIFNLNSNLPTSISKCEALVKFKAEHRDNSEYFLSSKSDRSINLFVNDVLIKSGYFDSDYKYLSTIKDYCKIHLNKVFFGDKLSKALQYTVKTGKLKSMKKPIQLKNGGYGKREVDAYYL